MFRDLFRTHFNAHRLFYKNKIEFIDLNNTTVHLVDGNDDDQSEEEEKIKEIHTMCGPHISYSDLTIS